MCSMIGRPATGTNGLGWRLVRGRSRDPSPPAMTTAFISWPAPLLASYSVAEDVRQVAVDPRVDALRKVALDLLWTWQPAAQRLFRMLDPERWEQTHQNPVLLMNQLGDEALSDLLRREDVAHALDEAQAAFRAYYDRHPQFYDAHAPLVIGYFSLEFGIAECLPIYSGGLGVLAGDHLKAMSDLGIPLVGIGLLYRNGFCHQGIDAEGRQYEVYPDNHPEDLPIQRVSGAAGEPLT